MESKLDRAVLEEYISKFSALILDGAFKDREVLNGQDLLSLTPIKQLNFFLVYSLLIEWRSEFRRLKSPYFDYKSKEVRKAQKEFMNVLSKNIRVGPDGLEGILEKATRNALLLFLSPYDFFVNQISHWGKSRIKLKEVKELAKYVKINTKLLDAYIKRLSDEDSKDFFTDDATRILNEVFESTEHLPEEVDAYAAQFSEVLPLNTQLIYGEEDQQSSPLPAEVSTTETLEKVEKSEADGEVRPTVNDQFSNPTKKNLAEVHAGRVESIKSRLTINQKFMFINQLFEGSSQDFNNVIDFLDNCPSQAEAMDFINNNYLKKNNWNKDSSEVREFVDMIAKKYA